jgi:mRNA interferase RelE/StbE
MLYRVIFTNSAAKAFRKLERKIQIRLRPKIDQLAQDPRPKGAEKLAGTTNGYRIRIGNQRILYQIKDEAVLVTVVKLGHRKDVYRK